MSARLIEVIETDVVRGSGVDGDPYRTVMQYYSKDGELLAENDVYRNGEFQGELTARSASSPPPPEAKRP